MTELKRGTSRDFKFPILILFLVSSNIFSSHTIKGGESIRATSQIWPNLAIMKHKKPKLRKIQNNRKSISTQEKESSKINNRHGWTKLRVRFLKTFRSFSFSEFCSVLNFDITALRDMLVCHEAVTIFILFYDLTYVQQHQ